MVYRTAERFEEALRKIAKEQEAGSKHAIEGLPVLPDLRVALDVAAADLRPLVVLYSKDEKERARMRELVRPAAWSEKFVGRLRYVVVDDSKELEAFEGLMIEPGVSVVQAEAYGRGGRVLAHAGPRAPEKNLSEALKSGLGRFDAEAKNVRDHLRTGEREGIEWESAIPVSDPGRR